MSDEQSAENDAIKKDNKRIIDRVTAATEISWLVERAKIGKKTVCLINAAIIRALGYPESWWEQHIHLSVRALLTAILADSEKDILAEYRYIPDANKVVTPEADDA